MAIETTRLDPVLLTDEEMHQFLVDGFLILQPTVPVGTHETIDEKFTWLVEHETNPGNNILPRLPELNLVLESPEVRGAIISLLGLNYLIHPHRYWHYKKPSEMDPDDQEKIWAQVMAGSHQDSYSPSRQPKSHHLRYARFMYYSHDVEEIHGPTHVIPGSHFHAGIADEDRAREIPVIGPAGTVFLSHFELGHAAGVNLSDRVRHMIKFLFMRTEEPGAPSWQSTSTVWKTPEVVAAPYDLEPAWRHHWSWLCGVNGTTETAPAHETGVIDTLLTRLNAGPQVERTCAIYELAVIGNEVVGPLTDLLSAVGEQYPPNESPYQAIRGATVTMDDAAYTLGAMGADAVESLIGLLDSPHEWTRINAVFALGEIGSKADCAVPRLVELLHDPFHGVIRFTANALGNIGDAGAQKALCHLLDTDSDAWKEPAEMGWSLGDLIHVNVAMALARLGAAAADSEADIIRHLNHPCGQVGIYLIEALRRIGAPSALDAVVRDLAIRRWDASLHDKRQF